MLNKIDLHIHTTISDGILTPKEVIDEAYKNGVKTISISDHDTVEAYTDELCLYAKNKKIELITGVEISTKIKKNGIHVLGYNFDLTNKELIKKLKLIREARHVYLYDVSIKLRELKYVINTEKINMIDAVTKAHIAMDIINNPRNKEILLENFGHIPNKGEFIENVMNEDCPAYVEKKSLSPREASEIIRNANGKVVLAHPVAYMHEDNFITKDILNLIKDMQPDGLEANYIYVDKNNNIIDEIEKWNNFAKENNLFVTIGSDFHLKDGIRPEIGFANMKYPINNIQIKQILKNIKS